MKIVLIRKKTGALVIVILILNMRPAAMRCEMSVMAYSTSVGTSVNAEGNLCDLSHQTFKARSSSPPYVQLYMLSSLVGSIDP